MLKRKYLWAPVYFFMFIDSFCQVKPKAENSLPIKIIITYNNCSSDSSLRSGPGFSAWIEYGSRIILFDTGSDYFTLLENMTRLGLNYNLIDDIFISHNHWDHVYGIPGVAGIRGFQVNTFIPKTSVAAIAQQIPRLQITAVDIFKELYPGIWTTGEMSSPFQNTTIAEQSLILDHTDGLIVIVGCSHPSIESIVNLINANLPGRNIKLLAGGFHLENKSPDEVKQISDFLKNSGVKCIAPSHCTGDSAIEYFKKNWGENYAQLFLGDKYITKQTY
jgi:7,8-dihydropterin-6-yl-methyl-4-(beta-D-ribofuranosyl)aminobenzene 5'-phosphate synthase